MDLRFVLCLDAQHELDQDRKRNHDVCSTEEDGVTAMLRFGSLLMIFLVTVPLARDCCLPVAQLPPCHESKHTDDVTCLSNQQAIAETKTALPDSSIDNRCAISDDPISAILTQIQRAPDRVTLLLIPTADIYLRTGALLI
jgi:hypothetical protein